MSLCIHGLNNEAIAAKLGVSIGTVNTYWLRIRLKAGGTGRVDSVARVIQERSEKALRDANLEREDLTAMIRQHEQKEVDLRAALALLQLAMDQVKSTVWATDRDLKIQIVANGDFPSTHFGVVWEPGKTVYECFGTTDDAHPVVACHLEALTGRDCNARLQLDLISMTVRVMPLRDESDEVMGCISILNLVGEPQDLAA